MNTEERLRAHGIQPSAQRVAVAECVLTTDKHPSADEIWASAKRRVPVISRATVYNTVNLFVKKGLLKELNLAEGRVVYDPMVSPHHHFVDEGSGRIYDIPWDALSVGKVEKLKGFRVDNYQVVLRGRKNG